MNKQQRHFAIKDIIHNQSVASHEELSILLKKRGFNVTQATLSRDLTELGVVRLHTENKFKYIMNDFPNEQQFTPIVSREVTSIDRNETVIVIRTLPGRAQGVASYVDSLKNPLILGTLAGDDTVFVTCSSIKKIGSVEKFIKDLLLS